MKTGRIAVLAGMLALVAGLSVLAGWLGHRAEVMRMERTGSATLEQAADWLSGQVDRYRYLPPLIARHPQVLAALQGGAPAREEANRMLETAADVSGALDIYVMDGSGLTIAASNWLLDRSFIGQNFVWRPYFQRAMTGVLGYYHAVGTTSNQRGFYFAHPVRDPAGAIIGAVAVKIDLGRIEDGWRVDRDTLFFSDAREVIFLSSRAELVLRALRPDGPGPIPPGADAAQYAGVNPVPLGGLDPGEVHGRRLWQMSGLAALPARALWLEQPIPTLGLTGNILLDMAPAERQALLWASLTAACAALVILGATVALERRAALRRQLSTEERAKARLEAEVRARTAALSAAVARLENEVSERIATEARLRTVQDQLVQAEKLRALGALSAGISHELNQPLTAIQTLAENGGLLLERGEQARAATNLGRIAELAQRGGRIIRNLRAFARNEAEPATEVDLVAVVGDALDILEQRLAQAGVEVEWDAPRAPVMVIGGRVRLQQVVVNLLGNASDAMEGQPAPRRVVLSLERGAGRVRLRLRDTGPGLADPGRLFDPFYTTKPVGTGLGLGLSISYGIVQSFGGEIRGENASDGGAVFTVELPAVGGASVAA
ncbi:sensor histidine kinase [Halovulum dunhuangense]|uniref:C4-dicarboxylate transport sensor protein DctB n=1 Tax=Halovulum dunhuangense TaxID=1505036 RepID=A0A849L2L6_9RHOB|nr:ATP-binding protein [Halovulum dunhuangense]NNU80484.1 sensor histidine kinase [Halovulum dunhuangense]